MHEYNPVVPLDQLPEQLWELFGASKVSVVYAGCLSLKVWGIVFI